VREFGLWGFELWWNIVLKLKVAVMPTGNKIFKVLEVAYVSVMVFAFLRQLQFLSILY